MSRRVADRRGLGRQGLDQHPAAALAAPAAPGELGHQREGALLGTKVGEPKRRVGVEHDAQDDVGEVVSLGDHLGAHQHARLRLLEAAQDLGVATRVGGAVGVETEHGQGRHRLAEHGGQALGTRAVASRAAESHSGHDSDTGSAWPQ